MPDLPDPSDFPTTVLIALYLLSSVLVLAPALYLALWVIYTPLVLRAFSEPPLLPAEPSTPLYNGEECEIPTHDGLILRGTYLKSAKPRRGVILFCHGLNNDRWNAPAYLDPLHAAGYDFFTFDFRNHGWSDSQPNYRPLPWLTTDELRDVRSVVNYLLSRDDALPDGLAIFGVSKGGAAALCAAAADRRIRAVVTDGAFPTEGIQKHYMRRFLDIHTSGIPLFGMMPDMFFTPILRFARFLLSRQMNCRFVHIEPIARRVRQPVFMVHGQRDSMVPLSVAKRLRSHLTVPSKLWVASQAKHNMAIHVATGEYHRRLLRFFNLHLCVQRKKRRATGAKRKPVLAEVAA